MCDPTAQITHHPARYRGPLALSNRHSALAHDDLLTSRLELELAQGAEPEMSSALLLGSPFR